MCMTRDSVAAFWAAAQKVTVQAEVTVAGRLSRVGPCSYTVLIIRRPSAHGVLFVSD